MNLQKQQNRITELYRRGDLEGAREGFGHLIAYLEDSDQTDLIEYREALLGHGSLLQNDLDDPDGAEKSWSKIVADAADVESALALDPEAFDLYTQALLLLALVQRDLGKNAKAEKNLKLLREIAVEIRGEKSPDVKAIDEHILTLKK